MVSMGIWDESNRSIFVSQKYAARKTLGSSQNWIYIGGDFVVTIADSHPKK